MPTLTEAVSTHADAALTPRPENLGVIFQELLTAIGRLRADRQDVGDAELFRRQILQAIRLADQQARARGYTEEDIQLAVFAVVAYLDETILNLHKPIFRDWVRKPLQEELFHRHTAGEIFFQQLDHLLGRRDSEETADVLEIYYLCLLLGFLGRYSIASRAELRSLMAQTEEKIQRIRKMSDEISPYWRPTTETGGRRADPWIKRLAWIAGATGAVWLVLFAIYKFVLSSGVSSLEEITTMAVK